jgi:hypothetical protein
MNNRNIPRVSQLTKSKSRNELAAQREWDKAHKRLADIKQKHPYGTPEAKAAWLAQVRKTRSF